MTFNVGVRYSFDPAKGHRASLYLISVENGLGFIVPSGSGVYNHLLAVQLRDLNVMAVQDRAFSLFGSPQPIGEIVLDEDDLDHMRSFRVN